MRILIIYAHPDAGHDDRPLALANSLRSDGFDARLDRYEIPLSTWAEWSEKQLAEADAVIVVCGKLLASRFAGEVSATGKGRGIRYEARLIRQATFDEDDLRKFIPVFIDEPPEDQATPPPLRGLSRFVLWDEYHALLERLEGRSSAEMPPIGSRPKVRGSLAIPGWASVSFEHQRDLGRALRGESLGPRDVDACPEFAEAGQVLARLRERHLAILVGPSGSGKSMTAFHVAHRLAREGSAVLRLVDPGTAAAFAARTDAGEPRMFLIDDAHLLPRQAVEALADLARPGTDVLLVGADEVPGRWTPVRLDQRRAVATLAESLGRRLDGLLPLLRELDPHIGELALDTPAARVLAEAAEARTPWQFMSVLGRAELRIDEQLDALSHDGDALLVLLGLSLSQVASYDGRVPAATLSEILRSVNIVDQSIERGLRAVRRLRLLDDRDDRLGTPHPRVALSVVRRVIAVRSVQVPDMLAIMRAVISTSGFPLRGRAWLLRELHIAAFWLSDRLLSEPVCPCLMAELEAATEEDGRVGAAWMLDALTYVGDRPTMGLAAGTATGWLRNWFDLADSSLGYPLGNVINNMANDDRHSQTSHAEAIVANYVDPEALGRRISGARPGGLGGLAHLLDRALMAASVEWRAALTDAIDIEALLASFASWPSQNLWEVAKLVNNLLWLSPDRGARVCRSLHEPIRVAFHENLLEAWSDIDDLCHWGLGFSVLHSRDEYPPTADALAIAGEIAHLIEPRDLASAISEAAIRDWHSLAYLLGFVREVAPDIAHQAAQFVDLEALTERASSLWVRHPRDLEDLLVILALTRDYEPAAQFLRINAHRVQRVTFRTVLINPLVAVEALRNGATMEWDLEGGLPQWTTARASLLTLARHDPDLAGRSLSAVADRLADGMGLRQANGGKGCPAFLEAARNAAPAAIAAACERIEVGSATANWQRRLTEGAEPRAAALAVLRAAASHSGPARESAQALLEAAPDSEEGANRVAEPPPFETGSLQMEE